MNRETWLKIRGKGAMVDTIVWCGGGGLALRMATMGYILVLIFSASRDYEDHTEM